MFMAEVMNSGLLLEVYGWYSKYEEGDVVAGVGEVMVLKCYGLLVLNLVSQTLLKLDCRMICSEMGVGS